MWVFSIVLKFDSGLVSLLLFSISSRQRRALLEFSIAMDNLEMFLLQCLRAHLSDLNFLHSTDAAFCVLTGLSHMLCTVSKKPG